MVKLCRDDGTNLDGARLGITGSISVVVPILNPGRFAQELCDALARQTLQPVEWIVLDSESDDGSAALFARPEAHVEKVDRATFNHGRVRNRGVALCSGDIIVFLTQDAIPDENCLERLVAPLRKREASASFARQVPRPNATPLETFARTRNYPPTSRMSRAPDLATRGVEAVFFSDACSAIRRDTLEAVGGFPEHTVMNEDMLLAARILRTGGSIAYVAEATAEHSHRLGTLATFKRYFDIGAFFVQAGPELESLRLSRAGLSYGVALFGWLIRQRQFRWLLPALVETIAKWFGLRLGRLHRLLPLRLVRELSGHPGFWNHVAAR